MNVIISGQETTDTRVDESAQVRRIWGGGIRQHMPEPYYSCNEVQLSFGHAWIFDPHIFGLTIHKQRKELQTQNYKESFHFSPNK